VASFSDKKRDPSAEVAEYEKIIAAFERINGELRLRKTNASPAIRDYCERHIAMNSRTLEAMRQGLEHAKRSSATPFPKSRGGSA
jgi:hypothetical protein